ncbi:MAG: SusC/RagA family TonB-linked outer membrane protein [Mangrovibacterium sp.]
MKKITLLLAIFAIGLQSVLAQTREITGTVTSAEDGSSLPGVSVSVRGTTLGTITDINGEYTIKVPTSANTLIFSFVGMQTKEVEITGSKINVTLDADVVGINEVVVTAIGITRQEKSLGYSVGVVKSDELEKAREGNVVNSLAGRVAGLNIMQSSGTAGGASKVIIRGQSSLGSSGQPIFIIDGMPVSNSTLSFGINGSVDTGSRIGDLSSDDIASVSVLKGAAATALYGARAKDGAIIITTKQGSKNTKTFVSVNSSVRFENPLELPSFQNEFGPGVGATGAYSMGAWNGWGPKISDVQDTQYPIFTGDQVTLKAYKDNVKDFYDTGMTYTNNISIGGGDSKNDYRIGVTALNQTGIIPNNKYDRYNITFNGGREFSEKLSTRISFSYINASSEGRPAQGSNDANVIIPTINAMPRTMDVNLLKDNWIKDGKPYPLGSGAVANTNNPYWVLNRNKYTSSLDRIIGSLSFTYKPIKGLVITDNLGTDFFYDKDRRIWATNTIGEYNKGRFFTYNWDSKIINNDLIVSYEFTPAKDFGIKILGGHNIVQTTTELLSVDAKDLLVADIYAYSNAQTTTPTNTYSRKRLMGVYGDIGFSYKDIGYLNITGRNDWSSTMPLSERSYFYPSVSGSFVFSELIPKNKILDFGKLRINYAIVGSDTDPYQLDYVYSPVSSYFIQFLGQTGGLFPHGGLLGYSAPGVYPDPDLKPQKQSGFEIGADLRFLNGRIALDATYYSNKTTNHIARIDAPNSTGYFNFRKNSGEISNKGVEIMLNVVPVQKNFKWDLTLNFASNEQKVVELDPSITELNLTSGYSSLQIKAAVGEPFSLYGIGWLRDDQGNIVIDGSTGFRKTQSTAINLGKITPDYTLGIINSFSYKGLSMGFVIDIRQGGVMFSGTAASLRANGVAKETLLNDREPIVDKGVVLTDDGEYVENTKEISAYNYWSQNYTTSKTEANVFDASYVKLREITLNYTLPRTWFDQMFIKNISVGFEARNLWLISSNVPHIDPELNFFSPGDIGSGVEFASIPTTRSYGFNLKFNF